MTSGSSRRAPRRALANELVWMPTSRWLMRHFFDAVHELDRILDGQDVALEALVDVVDHRRQRRRLARSGRSGDQHQALLAVADVLEDLRQTEVVHGHHLGGDEAKDRAFAHSCRERR
jgi:hypothetical protein